MNRIRTEIDLTHVTRELEFNFLAILMQVSTFFTACEYDVCVDSLFTSLTYVCLRVLWRQLLLVSRSPADSRCGLPKWWRAAQPLLPPKLQGTKTTNKSKSRPGVGVGGGGVDVVVSFDWCPAPALLPLTRPTPPGAGKSVPAGPQGAPRAPRAPRQRPWRWWDIGSSLFIQSASINAGFYSSTEKFISDTVWKWSPPPPVKAPVTRPLTREESDIRVT